LYAARHLEWYASQTNWPGDSGNWQLWEDLVREVATWVQSVDFKDRIDLDIWNEPDYCPNNSQVRSQCTYWKRDFARFVETYTRARQIIKSAAPLTRVVGPSAAGYNYRTFSELGGSFFDEFLRVTKTRQILPDVVSFHELGDDDASSLVDRVRTVRGIVPASTPISINEILHPGVHQRSATMISYFAGLELSLVESSSRACWPDPHFTSDTNHPAKNQCHLANLDGLLTISNPLQRRQSWWLVNDYANMQGKIVLANPKTSNKLAVIATLNESALTFTIMIGNLSSNTVKLTISEQDLLTLTRQNFKSRSASAKVYDVVSPVRTSNPRSVPTLALDAAGAVTLPELAAGQSLSVKIQLR
jgi:hypothetical protein